MQKWICLVLNIIFEFIFFYFKVKYLKYEYKVKYEENLNALSRVLKLNQTGVTHIDCKYLQMSS